MGAMSQRKKGASQPYKRHDYCNLCYATRYDLNNEDVLPMWLRTVLQKWVLSLAGEAAPAIPAKTLLKICKRHNSTLARQLEDRIAPALKKMVVGEAVTLSADEQRILLSWLVKTSTLFDLVAFNEHARREFQRPRGERGRDELRQLVLDLADRSGQPLPVWSTALTFIDTADVPMMTTMRSAPTIRQRDRTHISWYGSLAAFTTTGTPEQIAQFQSDMSQDARMVLVTADAAEEIKWPPQEHMSWLDLQNLRVALRHTDPMGWRYEPNQLRRQASRTYPTTVLLGDDAQNLTMLADAFAKLNPDERFEIDVL